MRAPARRTLAGLRALMQETFRQTAILASVAIVFVVRPSPLHAQDWTAFGIREAGFTFAVPPGFSPDQRADDGQAATFEGADGAFLSVRGDRLSGQNFRGAIEAQMAQDESEGWNLTYRRLTDDWASYSGVKDGLIRYVRAIALCNDRAAVFQMDYSRSDKIAYDPIVVRMVKSLAAEGC